MSRIDDVAVFIDNDLLLDEWQLNALQIMIEETDARVSMLIINEGIEEESRTWFEQVQYRLSNYWPWVPVSVFHRNLRKITGPPKHRRKHHVDELNLESDIKKIKVKPIKINEYSVRFPKEVISKIENSADIGVLFGFGIIKGEILSAPRHGILGFHHGDMRKYRGTLPGFWEFIKEEDEVGITLQILGEELDSGKVVAYDEVTIERTDTWQDIKAKLYGKKSENMLAKGIISMNEEDFKLEELEELGETYTHPKQPAPVIKYLIKNTFRKLRK